MKWTFCAKADRYFDDIPSNELHVNAAQFFAAI
jgi:hypothetical protein